MSFLRLGLPTSSKIVFLKALVFYRSYSRSFPNDLVLSRVFARASEICLWILNGRYFSTQFSNWTTVFFCLSLSKLRLSSYLHTSWCCLMYSSLPSLPFSSSNSLEKKVSTRFSIDSVRSVARLHYSLITSN